MSTAPELLDYSVVRDGLADKKRIGHRRVMLGRLKRQVNVRFLAPASLGKVNT